MSVTLEVATRKGLFSFDPAGRALGSAFLGEPVTAVAAHPDGTRYAALELGHFGVKLFRKPAGGEWAECGVPTYPPEPDPPETDGFGRPLPWKLVKIWILEVDAGGRLWAGTIPGGVFRSDDRGDSWQLQRSLWDDPRRKRWFGGGYDAPGVHSIAAHPGDADDLIVGVSCGGAWRTRDGGTTFELAARGMIADFMPPDQQEVQEVQDPHRIVRCPSDPDALWCQHHNGVFKSRDGGASWERVATHERGLASQFGFAVAVHPADPDTAWLVPAQKDERRIPVDGRFIAARTVDGGASWTRLTRGLPEGDAWDLVYRHALDVDPTGARLAMGSTTGNLWITEDGGDAWRHVSAHLPPIYAVRYLGA